MNIKEPKPMREIHKIREKIYLETKDKNISEIMKYIRDKAKKFERTLHKKETVIIK